MRFHPSAPLRAGHRLQHYYVWPLYVLAWIGELNSQLRYLVTGRVADISTPSGGVRCRSFLVEKAIWLCVMAPYAVLVGSWRLAVLVVTATSLGGFVTVVVLVVGHVNTGLVLDEASPVASASAEARTARLVRTTASFGTSSLLLRWLTGGMTHHLAHHVFPAACRHQLPGLHHDMVVNVARAGVREPVVFGGLSEAVIGHWRALRSLGRLDHRAAHDSTVDHVDA